MSKNIRVDEDIKSYLDYLKEFNSETYNSLLRRLISWFYRYKTGYKILRKYFDNIDIDEDKSKVLKELKGINL